MATLHDREHAAFDNVKSGKNVWRNELTEMNKKKIEQFRHKICEIKNSEVEKQANTIRRENIFDLSSLSTRRCQTFTLPIII
jgi:hypothetical protein